MLKAKWTIVTFGMLFVLVVGNTAYAAETEDFFWSDSKPWLPSCTQESSRGNESVSTGRIGLVTDHTGGEFDRAKFETELPTCEEANKSYVAVLVNGKYLQTAAGTGAEPFIENGRTMIPLRAIADAFGFAVKWDGNEGEITLTKEGRNIIVHIGKAEILVDGETLYFQDAVPIVKNRRTFLPASKLAEILGIQVDWDGDTQTATFIE